MKEQDSIFELIDIENSNIENQVLIGKGGYASVYKVTRNNKE